MHQPVSPVTIAQGLDELWSPRVIAELDDAYVKVAKVFGTFGWHAHAEEDELFHVLAGSLRIELEQQTAVVLQPGDVFVVPKGVRHNPVAEAECLILLIEKKSTAHSGDQTFAHTRSLDEQRRPLQKTAGQQA
jgi:quercetin dioxygenase-like cupin family protein